ncbi:MAG: hypothetical protein ACLPX5_12200 [Dissulfurispiraceae bacterium]
MRPQKYRETVRYLQCRKPCVECNDRDASFCVKIGLECGKFKDYEARLRMKGESHGFACQE